MMDPLYYALNGLVALILALLLNMVLARGNHNALPLIYIVMQSVLEGAINKLNKPSRSQASRLIRGMVVAAFILIVALSIIWGVHKIVLFGPAWEWLVDIVILMVLMAPAAPILLCAQARKGEKFLILSRSMGQDLNAQDKHGIVRQSVLYAGQLFDKALIVPLFWYIAVGIDMAIIASVLAGYMYCFGAHGRGGVFFAFMRGVELLVNIVPHIIAVLILTLACFAAPRASIARAFRGLMNFAPYNMGGACGSVIAYAFMLTMGGPQQKNKGGQGYRLPWIGPEKASARLDGNTLPQIQVFFVVAVLLVILTLSSFSFLTL